MHKPFTQFLLARQSSLEAKLASLDLEDPKVTIMLENYQRIQTCALVERIESDFEGANRDARLKLYQQLIQIASIQERASARAQRERQDRARQEARLAREQERSARAQAKAAKAGLASPHANIKASQVATGPTLPIHMTEDIILLTPPQPVTRPASQQPGAPSAAPHQAAVASNA